MIALILINISVNAQVKNYLKTHWKQGSLMFIAGSCDGQVETLQHHYKSFKSKFPKANDQFWNPDISHTNKYKNNNPSEGPAFLFSKNALSFTTDGYHAFKMGQKSCLFAAVAININGIKKRKFTDFVIDVLFYSGCYTAGFYTTYKVLYR